MLVASVEIRRPRMTLELILLLAVLVAISAMLALIVLRRPRSVHAVQLQVPVDVDEAVDACRRALRSVDWREHASDTLTVPLRPDDALAGTGGPGPLVLDIVVSVIAYRLMRRLLPRPSTRAPSGPHRVDAELYAVWREVVVVRISLVDAGRHETDVIISGSDLASVGRPGRVREAVEELRRSISIQSGSLTPGEPSPRP